jgi:Na+-driven multidrug efflux pump
MFAYIVTSGIAQTTRTVVSTLIGADRQDELMPTVKRLWGINLVGVILLAHGFILYPELIAGMFFDSPADIAKMVDTFTTLFVAVIGFGVSSILLSTLEGSGGTRRAFVVEMIGAGTYLSGVYYLTSAHEGVFFPIHVIWRVEWIYFTFIALGCFIALRNGRWKKGLESLS